jgi:hypothetical protein
MDKSEIIKTISKEIKGRFKKEGLGDIPVTKYKDISIEIKAFGDENKKDKIAKIIDGLDKRVTRDNPNYFDWSFYDGKIQFGIYCI